MTNKSIFYRNLSSYLFCYNWNNNCLLDIWNWNVAWGYLYLDNLDLASIYLWNIAIKGSIYNSIK